MLNLSHDWSYVLLWVNFNENLARHKSASYDLEGHTIPVRGTGAVGLAQQPQVYLRALKTNAALALH